MKDKTTNAIVLKEIKAIRADLSEVKRSFATKDDLKHFSTNDDLKRFATKDDMKHFSTKDDLKQFATRDDLKYFATKDDLKHFATKDDLKSFATKDDLKQFATKDDLKSFPTKDDLKSFEIKTDQRFSNLSLKIVSIEADIKTLKETSATKDDIRQVMDHIDGLAKRTEVQWRKGHFHDHRFDVLEPIVEKHEERLTRLEAKAGLQ